MPRNFKPKKGKQKQTPLPKFARRTLKNHNLTSDLKEFMALKARLSVARTQKAISAIASGDKFLFRECDFEKIQPKDQALLRYAVDIHKGLISTVEGKLIPIKLIEKFFITAEPLLAESKPEIFEKPISISVKTKNNQKENRLSSETETENLYTVILKKIKPEDVVTLLYALVLSKSTNVKISETVFHGDPRNRNHLLSLAEELSDSIKLRNIWMNYLDKNVHWDHFIDSYPESITSLVKLKNPEHIGKKFLKTWNTLKRKNDGYRSLNLKKGGLGRIAKHDVKRVYKTQSSPSVDSKELDLLTKVTKTPEISRPDKGYKDTLESNTHKTGNFAVRRNLVDELTSNKNNTEAKTKLKAQRKTQEIEVREGAQYFRENILRLYDRTCCVTGSKVVAILEAAHIQDHHESKNNDLRNGLCLRSDIHTLFDRGLLKINASYSIQLDDSIKGSEYGHLEGQKINLPNHEIDYPKKTYIEWKFNKNCDD